MRQTNGKKVCCSPRLTWKWFKIIPKGKYDDFGIVTDFLISKGIDTNPKEFVKSTIVIKKHLQNHFSSQKFFSISETKFIEEIILVKAGVEKAIDLQLWPD